MRKIYIIIIAFEICLLNSSITLSAQSDSTWPRADMHKIKQELNLTLSGKDKYNLVNSTNTILNSGITVSIVAEAVLIDIYGKSNIERQKPYKIYHIKNYWIMDGSLPKGSYGGTFHIVLDDRDCKVIEITHGK